jgi:hypothetical protein
MIRVLAMISVAGLILSVVCLSLAFSLAGPELVSRGGWAWVGPFSRMEWNNSHDGHHHHHSIGLSSEISSDAAQASRDIAWTGSETLDIALPADVRYTQAAGPAKLSVRGPEETIRHVRLDHGRIAFDAPHLDADEVTIELSAPNVSRFVVSGSGHLSIADYKQKALAVRILGDGEVKATGAADTAKVEISGSGDADLADLAADGADVTISGSGEAKVGPKSWAKLNISGTGNISLLSHPRRLESQVSGSGHIEQAEADEERPAVSSPPPTKSEKAI